MTYLLTFFKFRVSRKLMRLTSSVGKISFQANAKVEKPTYKALKRDAYWISPRLTAQRIQEIQSVTGIITGLSYVSWVKMSVPELLLSDWNVKSLPQDFGKQINESDLLAFAYDVRDSLQNSDLYVMESFLARETKQYVGLSQIQLSSMLTVLLNDSNRGSECKEKVIFQKKFVMNYLYDIIIGSERISTRPLVENILVKSTYLAACDSVDSFFNKYPTIKVDSRHIEKFKQSEAEKQEVLSLALLLTVSFTEVNLLKNERSIAKIQKRRKYKKIKND